MSAKKTMTLNLTDAEMSVLEQMAVAKDLTKTGVLRQALKLYQLIDTRIASGEKVFVENALTKEKAELAIL
ncbi:transcriptional regulator [Bradyrhizobium sp. AUGA SZCCT0042]|uniref:transcriptional regulator n=1 Tax=Bradyrhizobium sp. AUGA SZCCT0042 TaxID=2807651 RepID=UPI001BAA6A77|nr:transcriptional regulator [Bradyrhizobium sp. AUGA SZCCT0042]MBR1297382.1 transcriptional regulator [Bradyrhizobium sp. AUGA SZCCT0042]